MTQFLRLAFRNVFRNRRRTLMTLAVAAGGASGLLLFGGFFSYLFWGFRETTIRNGVGHLQVFNPVFFQADETKVLEHGLTGYPALAAAIKGTPHVRSTAPRIEFFGMVSNGSKSATYMATAVDPPAEIAMGFEPNIVKGRDLKAVDEEVLLGSGLARSLNVQPGDGLTLLAVTADGALNGLDVTVVGITETVIKEMDDRMLRMTLTGAQRLLDTTRVSKLVVGLDDTAHTEAARAALAARLGSHTVKTWDELSPMYRQMQVMFGGMFLFIGVIVFFLVVISGANTAMMSIFERTREIGTMLAMGTPPRWIMALFLVEGAITGVLGALLGLAAGNGLAWTINSAAIELPPPPGNTAGYLLQVRHVPELMIATAVLVVLTLGLASLVPAYRASRVRIVDSLAAL